MNVVSFANMKGGVAKTTLAVNMAHTLSMRFSKKVLLVDLDPQFNATQCFFAPETYESLLGAGQKTIRHLFEDPEDLVPNVVTRAEKAIQPFDPQDLIYSFSENLDLILGDLKLYRVDIGTGSGREKNLARFLRGSGLEDEYDYVLIDCPPTPSVWMISALLASDSYLVPVKPEPLSTVGLDLFRGWLNRYIITNHGHQVKCAGVVLTLTEARTQVLKDAVSYFTASEVWKDDRVRVPAQPHLPSFETITTPTPFQQAVCERVGLNWTGSRRQSIPV